MQRIMKQRLQIKMNKSTESEQSFAHLENHRQSGLNERLSPSASKSGDEVITSDFDRTHLCGSLRKQELEKGHLLYQNVFPHLQIAGQLYNDFDWEIPHVNEVLSETSFLSTTSRNLC